MTDNEALKLKPGDLVVCNTEGRYLITTGTTICRFVEYLRDNFCFDDGPNTTYICISPAEGPYVNVKFDVNSFYFDKVLQIKEVSESELTTLLY